MDFDGCFETSLRAVFDRDQGDTSALNSLIVAPIHARGCGNRLLARRTLITLSEGTSGLKHSVPYSSSSRPQKITRPARIDAPMYLDGMGQRIIELAAELS